MGSTIVFDFDGTIAVGDGPVVAYAREMAQHADAGYPARVEAALAAFESGDPRFRDGYDAVGTLAEEAGVDAESRQAAYLSSRTALGTADARVSGAPGLPELLASLPGDTRVILATNAPETGIERLLRGWGVRRRFAELHFDVGKPAGLTPIVRTALAAGPLLAVGDIVVNDLEPAAALGADTALVGPSAATSPVSVTMRAATLAELAGDIAAWARAASDAAKPDPAAPVPSVPPESSVPSGPADLSER